jgi:8-oxo-dGTP pyrophosphatase MutT (NUDIX family)
MNFDTFLKSVSKIENIELPGESSQVKMSPPFRLEFMELYKEAKKTAKKAGVLILFYPNSQQQTHLVLILRKSYEGVHSAQVGFPGGKIERIDPSIEHAAIRETFEEIGIPKHEMKILRPLTELYIPPSNYTVYPFLGIAHTTPNFIIQEEEVESVIEVSLSHFLNEPNIIKTSVSTSYRIKAEVPAFLLNGHIVWGATAMMLSELKDLLKQVIK